MNGLMSGQTEAFYEILLQTDVDTKTRELLLFV